MIIIHRFIAALFYGLLSTIALAQPVITPPVFIPNDPTSLVLPSYNSVYANWKNAGLVLIGGIPNRTTQCGATVPATNLPPPQANDDAVKLNAAIAACTPGQFVQLGSGTFNYALSELPIFVNKGITVRGDGVTVGACDASMGTPCWGTVLQTYDGPQPTYNATPQCGVTIVSTTNCPNTSGFFFVAPSGLFTFGWGVNSASCQAAATAVNPTTNNCGTLLTSDAAKGDTTVNVASTANFSVGMWVLIDESPQLVTTTNPISGQASIQASSEFLNTTATPVVARIANPDGGNCTYSFCVNRVTQELHKIASIGTGTLTFDDSLTIGYRQSGSHDARVYWPTQFNVNTPLPFMSGASIENLTINRCTGGCINFQWCVNCWAENVEINYWIAGAVNFIYSARGQVTGSYLHNCIDCQNNGNEYPIGISTGSTEILVDNNIIRLGGKGMVGRAGDGNVVSYNYMDDTFYEQAVIGDWFVDMGVNGSHYAGTHHWLFEGNWGNNCDGDETHGNATYHTFFRNHCTSMRTTFVDPSNSLTVNDCAGIGFQSPSGAPNPPGPLRAFGPMAFNYWYAFVGNVGGQAGMQSCAGGTFVYENASANRAIWRSGWTGGEWSTLPDNNLNGVNNRFIFRHGDYDYVNASIVDWTNGFSHSLPNSFYRPTQPPYFGASGATCTYPWPWVTPTAGSPIQTNTCAGSGLPAKARFDAGTPFVQP